MKWRVESDEGVGATLEAARWACVEVGDATGIGFYKEGSDKMFAWFSGPRLLELIEGAPAARKGNGAARPEGAARRVIDPDSPIARAADNTEYTDKQVQELLIQKIGGRPRKDVALEIDVDAGMLGQVLKGKRRASAKMIRWCGFEPIDRRTASRE
jgi:hypothetical protein